MVEIDLSLQIVKRLCELGTTNRSAPSPFVEPFGSYFDDNGQLKNDELDVLDGRFTRKEILARYLLVSVVLDQGSDMTGVRQLLQQVTIALYRQGIKIFHEPLEFFRGLGLSLDTF